MPPPLGCEGVATRLSWTHSPQAGLLLKGIGHGQITLPRGNHRALRETLTELDTALFRLINGHHHPVLDRFFVFLTDFGNFEIPLIILALVLFVVAKPRVKYAVALLILAVLIGDMIGQDLKDMFGRLRPFRVLEDVHLPGSRGSSRSPSFPSNHAINIFAAATVLAWEFRRHRWAALICFVPASLVAYSRVYTGAHFPGDVIGGALIGITTAAAILSLDHRLPFVRITDDRRILINYLGLSILMLALVTLYRYSTVLRQPFPLAPEECQYWDWSRRLDLSYYSKPPLIAYFIRFFTEIFGSTPFGVRSIAVTLSLGIGLVTLLFTRDLFPSDRIVFFSMLTMNIVPLFMIGAIIITTDTPLMFFWALCCFALSRAILREQKAMWYLAGLAFGLGFLSKYAMIYIIPCLAVFFIHSREHRFWLKRPEPYLFLLIGFVMMTPVLIWSHRHGWVNFFHVAGQAKAGEGLRLSPADFAGYIGSQVAVVTPLIFLAMAWFAWRVYRREGWGADPRWKYLLSMSVPVYALLLLKSLQGPVLANWAAPAYFTGIIFAVAQFDKFVRERDPARSHWPVVAYVTVAFLLPLAVTVLFHDRGTYRSFAGAVAKLNAALPESMQVQKLSRIDPGYAMMGYDQLGREVTRILQSEDVLDPSTTFIFTQRYQIAAALAFYVKDQPRTYVVNFGDRRMTQYAIWGGLEDKEKWDAIYVTGGDGDDLEPQLADSFKWVRRYEPLVIKSGGEDYRRFTIYYCRKFSGQFPNAVESPRTF